ncbi:MAG TPA: 2-phospho-L-lactate transferase CofD family protein [Burkholderiales bacterium]|nr:2-phospho-L-lactate transferase CofD family protein [Burkholderiales bacterium]
MGQVVALTGQVGGAKLVDGFYRLRGKELCAVVNTGDDYEHLTLSFSPDIDTLLYTLAGIAAPQAPWEPAGESHALFATLKQFGGPSELTLGDRSLAAPLLRTAWLAEGRRLSEITLDFCKQLGISARVVPMSDDQVRTHVLTDEGAVTFQEYFTTLACEPAVRGFQYAGAEAAMIPPEVADALDSPDLEAVVICPANPYHTIRPILEVPGMRELMRKRGAPVIAVTPIVGGKALRGSAGKMMAELRHEASARRVALEYLRLIDGFVIDSKDAAAAEDVRASGIEVLVANTVMRTLEDRTALARAVLAFAQTIRERKLQEA